MDAWKSDFDQFILPGAKADLLGMLEADLPVGLGGGVGEVIVMVAEVLLVHLIISRLPGITGILLQASAQA